MADLNSFVAEVQREMNAESRAEKPREEVVNNVVRIETEQPQRQRRKKTETNKKPSVHAVKETLPREEPERLSLTKKTSARLTPKNHERLHRAVHLQAINNRKPDTIQGIINQAFDAWWNASDYE